MKKKLLACFLCAVMAVTMAVPAFAADDAGGIPPTWPDYGMANQYRNTTHCRLNVYIIDPSKITNGTNVTVYKFDHVGNPTLIWAHQRLSTGYYALRPVASTGANPYVLNINTNTKNCNLWAINQLPPEDYSIRFAHEGGDLRGVILIHRALALTVSAENMPAGGYNVKWEPSTGLPSTPTANPQIWDCFPEV